MRIYTVCENKLEMNKLIPVIWCKTCQSLLQLFSTLLEKDFGFWNGTCEMSSPFSGSDGASSKSYDAYVCLHMLRSDRNRCRGPKLISNHPFPMIDYLSMSAAGRLRHADEQTLIDKIGAKFQGWKGQLRNKAGRLAPFVLTCCAVCILSSSSPAQVNLYSFL